MKYKAGDKVKIVDEVKTVTLETPFGQVTIDKNSYSWLKKWLGKEVHIDTAHNGYYTTLEIKGHYLNDQMIEGLAEDGLTQEEFADQWSKFDFNEVISKTLEGKAWKEHEEFVKLVAKFRNIATACEIAEMRIKYLKENVMEVPLTLFEEHATAMNKYIELENEVDNYLESKGY